MNTEGKLVDDDVILSLLDDYTGKNLINMIKNNILYLTIFF
jgi:hypothetical protein